MTERKHIRKPTHLELQNKKHEAILDELCDMLKISREEYYQWLFDTGMNYLSRIFAKYEHFGKQMSKSAKFWRWWKNQYRILDEELINEFKSVDNLHEIGLVKLRDYYNECHTNTRVFLEGYLYDELEDRVKNEKVVE